MTEEELKKKIHAQDDERIFAVYEALRRGTPIGELHRQTKIDEWFLAKLWNLAAMERALRDEPLTEELYRTAKLLGFPDSAVRRLSGQEPPLALPASCKIVDTCGAEFEAETPYFYSSPGEEDEALPFLKRKASGKPVVLVFGSGPIRIGQGIEFDYASVHCVMALKRAGYEVAIVNNNPETVSTDFNTADRLYFDPLTAEDALRIVELEKPVGVVVAFGGQTSIKLTKPLAAAGVPILGTQPDGIDLAEDRGRFDALLEELGISRPSGRSVLTEQEALQAAHELGYPVLMRPSYVLGGQNMIIAFTDNDIREYMKCHPHSQPGRGCSH